MTYAGDRVLYDADTHIMELPDFLKKFADPELRDLLPEVDYGRSLVTDEEVAIIVGNGSKHTLIHKQSLIALGNRMIAEHGGLRADPDRRVTTHSVNQDIISRFLFVPYNLGWHIAHHLDISIPFRSLPEYHRELRKSGYIPDAYEYASYFKIWRALRSAI